MLCTVSTAAARHILWEPQDVDFAIGSYESMGSVGELRVRVRVRADSAYRFERRAISGLD